jgi:20S proteasome alpha/beta subunit
LFWVLLAWQSVDSAAGSSFDPYQNNGGLVSAVAGRDYVAIACDTRLMHGYEILSRDHVSSRLWMPLHLRPVQQAHPTSDVENDNERAPPVLPATRRHNGRSLPTTSDGSLRLRHGSDVSDVSSASSSSPEILVTPQSPVWIASSGCSADCEQLKRTMRSKLRAAAYFHADALEEAGPFVSPSSSSTSARVTTARSVATLLSQVLYGRRGFPFYAFCVVAGLSPSSSGGGGDVGSDFEEEAGGGQVFVYDAIGSHEQVCVATAGMGRELLQPILDRQFRSKSSGPRPLARPPSLASASLGPERAAASPSSPGDGPPDPAPGRWGWQQQRQYPTQVSCSAKETVEILRQAYEAVSEREIGVGDRLVVCVVRRARADDDDVEGLYETRITTFPLKKH